MPAGRKTKLTPAVVERFFIAIRAGAHRKVAAEYAGIGESTLYRWLEDARPAYREFRESLDTAEAEAELRALAAWQSAIGTDWRAARDFLARRHPDRWGSRERVDLGGTDTPLAPFAVTIIEVPDKAPPEER